MASTGTTATSAQKGKVPSAKTKPTIKLSDPKSFVGRDVTIYAKDGIISQLYGETRSKNKGDDWTEFEAKLLALELGEDGRPRNLCVEYDEGRKFLRSDTIFVGDTSELAISIRQRKEEEQLH